MARVPCTITHEPDAVDDGARPRRCACGYVGGINARDVSRYTGRRFDDAQPMYDALARQVTPDGAALAVPA